MDKVILTKEGFEKLRSELEKLMTVKRVEVAKQLETARAYGDLRENAEYETAKEAKSQLESKIHKLEERLAQAKVVDVEGAPTDKVYFGTKVDLKNKQTGDPITFHLVSGDEADVSKGKISIHSPIGKSLLGHQVGETVDVRVPAGLVSYEILKISR
ncbi:MAG: transcription elongation factor GreA [Omnitrophica bacterium RIFCSPLOWO2_12_FULL_50_11]|nr:MAG: transcription elongation factor GreA [Omnitrophica bacterium RIFCSPLOWO2_12_FULL_50_11]